MKKNNMDLRLLDDLLKNEKPFRKKQVLRAIYKEMVEDWSEATTLSLDFRKKLIDSCTLNINAELFSSKDGNTHKALISLHDDKNIEAVLMSHENNRFTVCVSCQVGCSMGCKFCATGQMGFFRNLTTYEILEQVLFFARLLKKKKGKEITNVVFMGMGEPFLNYDNVFEAIRIINDGNCFNIGSRKISISTCGVVEGIKKMAEEDMQVNLSISLHAPNSALREKIMPINNQYPLEEVLLAVDDYIAKTSRKVMYEYVMLKGLNDDLTCAQELVKLFRKRSLSMINLIAYNPTGSYESSESETVKDFKNYLETHGVFVTQRYEFGQGIDAACGQLASK